MRIHDAGSISVTDLAVAADMRDISVSQALRLLRGEWHRDGTRGGAWVRYTLADHKLAELLERVTSRVVPLASFRERTRSRDGRLFVSSSKRRSWDEAPDGYRNRSGGPGDLTVQAIIALNRTHVSSFTDKGDGESDLLRVRNEIRQRTPTIALPDSGDGGPGARPTPCHTNRPAGVARAARSTCGGTPWRPSRPMVRWEGLAWGDPALDDSTSRILRQAHPWDV